MGVNEELEVLVKIPKKKVQGGGVWVGSMRRVGWGGGGGAHGGCERIIEVFVKNKKKIGGGGVVWSGVGLGGGGVRGM